MNWTEKQAYALEKMRDGCNVFLTGEAGTGKSEVVKAFIEEMQEAGKNILVTAPTGIAADNLNGETLHRTFDAEIGVISNRHRPRKRNDLLEVTDIIVIDEISMCRIDLFQHVANLILIENDYRNTFDFTGSGRTEAIQLIVLGDFLQLPPVITKDDAELLPMFYGDIGKGFAFQSVLWDAFNFCEINLTEIVRQDDAVFKKILSKIRTGQDVRPCISFLMQHSSPVPFENEESIYLCGINRRVDEVNKKRLATLPGQEEVFEAVCEGDIKASDKFAENTLKLKPGCKVMLTVNDPLGRYKNGSMGRFIRSGTDGLLKVLIVATGDEIDVCKLTKEITKPVPKTKTVKTEYLDDNGDKQIRKEIVTVIEHEKVGEFTQYPLRLAYAITIHKSQGQTFDYVNIDPYCWDEGQFYTAISRGRRLENICFTQNIQSRFVKTSKAVLKKFPGLAGG